MANKARPCQQHPEWDYDKRYDPGDIVQHRGVCHICVGVHTQGVYWQPYDHPEQKIGTITTPDERLGALEF